MLTQSIPDQIRELVSHDKLLEAGQLLTATHLKNEGFSQQRRTRDLLEQLRTGQLSTDEIIKEKSRITDGLLQAADIIEGKKGGILPTIPLGMKSWKMWAGIGLLIVLTLLLLKSNIFIESHGPNSPAIYSPDGEVKINYGMPVEKDTTKTPKK